MNIYTVKFKVYGAEAEGIYCEQCANLLQLHRQITSLEPTQGYCSQCGQGEVGSVVPAKYRIQTQQTWTGDNYYIVQERVALRHYIEWDRVYTNSADALKAIQLVCRRSL